MKTCVTYKTRTDTDSKRIATKLQSTNVLRTHRVYVHKVEFKAILGEYGPKHITGDFMRLGFNANRLLVGEVKTEEHEPLQAHLRPAQSAAVLHPRHQLVALSMKDVEGEERQTPSVEQPPHNPLHGDAGPHRHHTLTAVRQHHATATRYTATAALAAAQAQTLAARQALGKGRVGWREWRNNYAIVR